MTLFYKNKESRMMLRLKEILFQNYGGFSDKRIKDLKKSSRFIVDDRTEQDYGANKKLYFVFCSIFVEVLSDDEVQVRLIGNVPISSEIEEWTEINEAVLQKDLEARLLFKIKKGNEGRLYDLAEKIMGIVAPGAPRYNVPSYKYICPRTGRSLKRLAKVLEDAWQ